MNKNPDSSLRKRLIVIDIMIPTVVIFSFIGGWPFVIFVAAVLAVGAWEFYCLYQKGEFHPSFPVMLFFILSAVLLRQLFGMQYADAWLAALVIVSMFVFVIGQQRGNKHAAVDFGLTVAGAVYLGWLGSFAVSIRNLDHGLLWVFLVFPSISLADSGGYIFGRLFGKHKMLPLVSPKKSWEGYVGGIFMGGLGTWGLAALWHIASPAVLPVHGLLIGVLLSILAPFGDFGESMLKRQFNLKDTSQVLPGHGGILDRIDTSLWAAALGFFLIQLFK
jgi:phosphatidate cytidylyltransferase